MRGILLLLLALPLLSQAPAKGTKAFFLQDPKVVIAACAEQSMTLTWDGDDGEKNAEWGRAFLAAGQREKAEGLFSRARPYLGAPYHSRLEASGWLRTGHRGEGLALLHSAPFTRMPPGGLFTAAQELFRAGFPTLADAMVVKAHDLDPKEDGRLLDCAVVAGEYGAPEQALNYARLAVASAPGKAQPLAMAARIVSEALHPLPTRSRTAPWAQALGKAEPHQSRKVFLLSKFPLVFGTQNIFPYGTGETRFNKGEPDRERFTRAVVADMSKALGGAPQIEPEGGVQELQVLLPSMGSRMGAEDRLVAIEELYMGWDEVSRHLRSEGFLMTRIRLVAFDRTGVRLRSHSFSIVTMKPDAEDPLAYARAWVKQFLEGPGFKFWID